MKIKTSLIAFTVLLAIALACNKDKFTTIPQVKFKSISPSTVFSGDVISMKGSYTDLEGDIDTVFVVRKFYAGSTATKIDTIEKIQFATLGVPAKTTEAGIEINYEYNTTNLGIRYIQGVSKDTNATLGLVLKDKAGNRSVFTESE